MTIDKNKGFSGLSSKETQFNQTDNDVEHASNKDQPSNLSSTTEKKSSNLVPPPISLVEAPSSPPPALLFLKKYWLWVLIVGFVTWTAFQSDKSDTLNSSLTETLPPYGSGNTLSSSQIYYCLAEKTRIDANESSFNKSDNYAISKFNNTVEDYNARCSNFRYKTYAMDTARKALEQNRYFIESQGRARN